jgi:hypothetical protein
MFGHEEKVSPVRLTAVQYVVLLIFLLLAYGLWRLQVMHSDEYALLAEKNRVRNVPILARAARFSIAKAGSLSIIIRPSPLFFYAIPAAI